MGQSCAAEGGGLRCSAGRNRKGEGIDTKEFQGIQGADLFAGGQERTGDDRAVDLEELGGGGLTDSSKLCLARTLRASPVGAARGSSGAAAAAELKAGRAPSAGAAAPGWAAEAKATKAPDRHEPSGSLEAHAGSGEFRRLALQLADAHENAVARAIELALEGLHEENRSLRERLAELGATTPTARRCSVAAGKRLPSAPRETTTAPSVARRGSIVSGTQSREVHFASATESLSVEMHEKATQLKDGTPDGSMELGAVQGEAVEVKYQGCPKRPKLADAGEATSQHASSMLGLSVAGRDSSAAGSSQGGRDAPVRQLSQERHRTAPMDKVDSYNLGVVPVGIQRFATDCRNSLNSFEGSCNFTRALTVRPFDLHRCWEQTPHAAQMQGSIAGMISMITSPKTLRISMSVHKKDMMANGSSMPKLIGVSEENRRKTWSQRIMANPGSRYRMPWDVIGMILIFWDSIYIPLGVYAVPATTFVRTMEWTTRIYWTIDIPLTFTVGFFRDGIVVMSPKAVAIHYLKSTFIIDAFVVTIDWALSGGSAGGILRVFRAARILRLLRIFKLKKILVWIQDHVNSEYTNLVVDFIKLVLSILLLSHFAACIFWHIGSSVGPGRGWISAAELTHEDLELQYVATLYWGLTALLLESTIDPTNTKEYLYCIGIVVCGLIGFSTIVSRITSLLLEIQNLRADTSQEIWKLRRFFRQVSVPPELRRRIMRYLEYHEEQKRQTIQWSELPILDSLTPSLRAELRYVGYMQAMEKHPLFEFMVRVSDVTMRRISEHALEEKALAEGDPLFFQGEAGTSMEVLVFGNILYIQKPPGTHIPKKTVTRASVPMLDPLRMGENSEVDDSRRRGITGGKGEVQFLAEPALWVQWHYIGDAYASSECIVITLNANSFGEMVKRCPYLHAQLARYGKRMLKYVTGMQAKNVLTDVWDKDRVNLMVNKAIEDMARSLADDNFTSSATPASNWADSDNDDETDDDGSVRQGNSSSDVVVAGKSSRSASPRRSPMSRISHRFSSARGGAR